jgi:hypothetical protein
MTIAVRPPATQKLEGLQNERARLSTTPDANRGEATRSARCQPLKFCAVVLMRTRPGAEEPLDGVIRALFKRAYESIQRPRCAGFLAMNR